MPKEFYQHIKQLRIYGYFSIAVFIFIGCLLSLALVAFRRYSLISICFLVISVALIIAWYREMEYEGEWFHTHHRYVFPVKDGCLGDYTAENFYHGRCGVKIPYRVTKKRKVPPCSPENR